jgi:serine/threonine-protein kinase
MSTQSSPGPLLDQKYRLHERIGGGGMGDVYRAVNVLAGRTVAIKLLHPELVDNEELAKRFFQEARAINRIRHPNVVDVLDAGMSEMGPYIVMDLLEGESMGQILARVGRLPVDAALATVAPVLEALDAAHRAGIVHRDLKPENVFVAVDAASRRVMVRLLDFGIAKVIDARVTASSPRTRTGIVFGTPDYLSPEQATGDRPLDGRSDLFAVGALLFELLTGAPPFRAPTAVATAFKVVHGDTPALAASGVHVEPRVEAILRRLLEKDPAARFQTAGDVVRKLARLTTEVQAATALARLVDPENKLGLDAADGPPVSSVLPSSKARRMRAMADAARAEAPARTGLEPTKPVPTGLSASLASRSVTAPSTPSPSGTGPTRVGSGTVASAIAVSPAAQSLPADPAASTEASAPRRLPSRFEGRFSVRGPVLRSVDAAIVAAFGRTARDGALVRLGGKHADDVRAGAINPLVSYELETLDAYLELATAALVHESERWRGLGRDAVGGELAGFLRAALRPAPDLADAARRGVSVWQRLWSFGSWRVAAGSAGAVTVHVSEVDPASTALRAWMVGVIEETARRATGRTVAGSIVAGAAEFEPELTCELRAHDDG